jgi:outer membrane protein OmpA-like peptidoglycan-associated protein
VTRPTLARFATLAALATTIGCATSRPPEAESKPPVAETPARAAPASEAEPASGRPGSYLDAQARELSLIPGLDVARKSDALILVFGDAELFEASSSALSAAGGERVRALAHTVAHYPKQQIIVKGHSDNERPERASQRETEDRADSVRNLLVAEGVLPSRVTAVGLGASLPLASNDTDEGRARNRRLEIELRPDEEVLQGEASR